MEWLWSLPFIPFMLCGLFCIGGIVLAFLLGRTSTDDVSKTCETAPAGEAEDVK
jgi:hypothetical protein